MENCINTPGNQNITIGQSSFINGTNNNIAIGYSTLASNTTGTMNIAYGYEAFGVERVREEKRILREKKLSRIYG